MFTPGFFRRHIRIFGTLLFLLLLLSYARIFAIGSPYQPGITNDPACQPNEINCFVQIIPNQTGNANKYLMSDGTQTAWSPYTLVLSGNLNTSGAFTTTLTSTATTNVTLPTSGTLSTLAGVETLTNKTLTSPLISLLIGGTTTTSPLTLRSTSGTGTTGADIIFQTGTNGSTEAMRVLNSGNVGIGDTNPASKLTVNGDIRIKSGSGGAIVFADGTSINTSSIPGSAGSLANTSDAIITGDSDANATGDVILKTASNDRFHILNGGNVGINTATPSALFSVGTSSPFQVTNTGAVTALTYNGNTIPAGSDTITGRATTDTLTNKSISGSTNTFTNIPNSAITNNFITINGSSISLGGSVSNLALTTTALSQFTSTTSAQLAGVISDETGSGNLVYSNSPVFTTPNIGNATGNITGNSATVTTNANLTGPITSVGNATTITATSVTNAMLAGSIASSKLVGSDIATVGTIISGIWNAGAVTSSGVIDNSISTTAISPANFRNTHATGFGSYFRGGNATNYALRVDDYSGVNALTVLGNGNVTAVGSITGGAASFTTGGFSGNVSTGGATANQYPLYVHTATNENLRVVDNGGVLQVGAVLDGAVGYTGFQLGNNWLGFNATGAATFASSVTGQAASFTTGAFTGNANGVTLAAATGTTNTQYKVSNTSGDNYFGVAASDGSSIFTGTTANAGYIGTNLVKPLQIATGGAVRMTISATGELTSTLTSGTVLTAGSATTGGLINNFISSGANFVWGINNSAGGNIISTSAYASYIFNRSNTDLVFGTNEIVRMTISGAGTTTFSGTETTLNYNPQTNLLASYKYLNFGGGSIMYRNATDVYYGSNAKYGSAGTVVANYTSANGMGLLTMDGGILNWQGTDTSVTAGTAYGVPIRFTILGNGNVGIGETNPTSANGLTKILELSNNYNVGLVLNDTRAGSAFEVFNAGAVFNVNYGSTNRLSIDGTSGTATFASSVAATNATFSGAITSTVTSGIVSTNVSGNTNSIYHRLHNTGADMYLLAEASAAGTSFIGSLAYASILGTNNSTALQLASGGIVGLTLLPGGNVGINQTSPTAAKLVIYSALETGEPGLYILDTDASTGSPYVNFQNSLGNNAGGIVHNGTATVSYSTTSDQRLKENIVNTHYGLSDLMNIQVSDFDFISDPNHQTVNGFIAQQLNQIYPDAVNIGGDDPNKNPWSVDYGRLTPLIVKSIQEMDIKVEAIPTLTDQTLYTKIADFLRGIAERGEAAVHLITADKVQSSQFCAGSTCMDEIQLKEVLDYISSHRTVTPPPSDPIPATPTCSDGIQNQDETGIDTGGVCTPPPDPTPTP